MKNKITGIFLIIILVFVDSNHMIYAKEMPDELNNLYARSAVLMDADSGRILFGKNESDVLPMASTTKIMTCILALENMEENEIGIVSDYARQQPKVHLGVRTGEKYYIKDLLYSLMLESHNDSAVIIAESIAGSVEKFSDLMNQKAKEIGCIDTYFISPNGLDAENEGGIHSTTATELALIMRYCIQESPKKEEFLEITQKESYQFTDCNKERLFLCHNHNALLKMMEGVISGKTGFTNNAGYCYVGVVQNEGRTFIISLLACGWPNNKNYKWQDARKLIKYGINNYEYRCIDYNQEIPEIYVKNGINEYCPFKNNTRVAVKILGNEIKSSILVHKDKKINIKLVTQENLTAPVKEGQKIGMVFYVSEGAILLSQDVVTVNKVEEKTIKKYLYYILKLYITSDIRKV